MTRRLTMLLLAAALCTPALADAQSVTPRAREGWTLVRVLKWGLLGTAVGFGGYALVHSTRADDAYTDLRRVCDTEPSRCTIDASGRYEDAAIERLFATTREEDRRAQVGIVGGQVTLFGSVGLFIYDLRHARGPVNIPYPSGTAAVGTPAAGALAVGAQVRF
jgi:hypothetical protein